MPTQTLINLFSAEEVPPLLQISYAVSVVFVEAMKKFLFLKFHVGFFEEFVGDKNSETYGGILINADDKFAYLEVKNSTLNWFSSLRINL